MLPSSGIICILLLASLWWTRSNGLSSTTNTTNSDNSSTTDKTPPTHQGTSYWQGPIGTTGITPSAINHGAPTMANKNATTKSTAIDSNTQSNSVAQRSTKGPVLSLTPQVANGSTNATNNFDTNVNRISPSSIISTTMNDLATVTESNNVSTGAGVSSKMASRNFTAVTYKTSSTSTISTKESLKSTTAVTAMSSPSNALTTLPTPKSGSVTTSFKTISQTTKVHQNSTNHSIAPSNPKQPNKENNNNGGVVLGAVVGAILGSALIGLIGYLICGKRKSGLFSHQRLYDDTRSEPVLRLDNSSYDVSFGDVSYYNPSTTNESAAQNGRGKSYDGIPMDDMAPSQPSS